LSKSHEIFPKRSVAVLVNLFWVGVMLTTSLVVWFLKRMCSQHYLPPKKLEPKMKPFVSVQRWRFGSGGDALSSVVQANDRMWESLLVLHDMDEGSARVVDKESITTADAVHCTRSDPIRWPTHKKAYSLKLPTGCCFVWKRLPTKSWFV